MHKLAIKHKLSTSGFSLYLKNLYPVPKMHPNSLLRNYLNYYHLFLKVLRKLFITGMYTYNIKLLAFSL